MTLRPVLATIAVVALALALRAPWLDRVGLQGDEDISTLAFRGILEEGVPELPSGNAYWRAPLYSYLAAPLAASGIDWLPRILSVFLSCLTAVLMIRVGPRWVGWQATLLGVLLFALSLPEIHTARQARFYVLYQPLALLAIYALDRFTESGTRRWWMATVSACLAAMVSHELGATLAVLFVIPVLRPRSRSIQIASLGTIALFAVLSELQRGFARSAMAGGARVAAGQGSGLLRTLGEAVDAFSPLLLLAVAAAGVALGALGFWGARSRAPLHRLVAAGGFAFVGVALAAGQLGLAVGVLVVLVLVRPDLLPLDRGGRALLALGGTAVCAALLWTGTTVLQGATLRQAVRALGGGPFDMAVSLLRPPAIGLAASLGAAAVLLASFRGKPVSGPRFLLLCVTILTVLRGAFASKIADRYMTDAWPLWELLAGWTVVEGVRWGARRLSPVQARALRWGVGAAVALAVLALPGTAPVGTLRYLARMPGEVAAGVVPVMVPDLRGAARFLEAHAAPGERVAATDWMSTYCYTRRVDLWLRSDRWQQQAVLVEGVPRDIYLGARVVPHLQDLRALSREEPLWVVAGGLELFQEDYKLDPALRRFLREHPAAWESSDGFTRVLRLGPP